MSDKIAELRKEVQSAKEARIKHTVHSIGTAGPSDVLPKPSGGRKDQMRKPANPEPAACNPKPRARSGNDA